MGTALATPIPVRLPSQEATTWSLAIGGMTCASCAGRVEKALLRVPGIDTATVNLATESATVSGRPVGDGALLIAAVADAGYGA